MEFREPFDPDKVPVRSATDGGLLHGDLTHQIIGAAMKVHRELGPGYPEAFYQRAMNIELSRSGLRFEHEKVIEITYTGEPIGHFRLDHVVEDKVLLELKAVEALTPLFRQQTLSYLKASGLRVGLLINFGEKSLRHE